MACVDHFLYVTFIIISTFVIFSCFHIELKENVSGLMGGGGGKGYVAPPLPLKLLGVGGGWGYQLLMEEMVPVSFAVHGSLKSCFPLQKQLKKHQGRASSCVNDSVTLADPDKYKPRQ